ncbi:MAG: LuxR C-terminal-related transcriptional regulator [Chloroflexota bacterium]
MLQTKLYLPIPRPDRVPRPRLTGLLDSALQPGGKLVLISAPAGSGKTTLVSAWLQALARPEASEIAPLPIHRPCWLSLDESDNDLVRFLVYLAAALERAAPGLGERALSLLRGPQSPPVESFMIALINDIAALAREEDNADRRLLLTLDDYHLIDSQAIHDALTFLVDHLPGQMRLILISRADPPLPLARWRGRGHLLALDGRDLRFTIDETRQFLNRVMGLDLSQEETVALVSQTEGWIAGLQMAALALNARGPGRQDRTGRSARPLNDQLAGSRLIMDYLLQEVLQGQPADLQEFLLQTSVLKRLSGPLCDAVTGHTNSQAILSDLERRNLFLFSLDQEGRWYRYHHLFAELLRQRLAQDRPEIVVELHRRAGSWYQAGGFMAEAIQHTLAAGDAEQAAGLVEKAADPALMQGQFQTVLSWISRLPNDAVRARPRLCVYQAFLMLFEGHPLTDVEVALRAAEEADPAAGKSKPAAGEAILIRAILALLQGDIETAAELSQEALTLLPDSAPFMISLALRNAASIHSMTGDTPAAIEGLTKAIALTERIGDKAGLIITYYNLARIYMVQGRLHAARETLARALALGRDGRGRPLPIVARSLISLADIKREWNELNEASRLVQDGIELARQVMTFWSLGGYVLLSQIRQAEGDVIAAQAAMDVALELAVRFDATELDDRAVELYQAQLWLAQGNIAAVERWASRILGDELASAPRQPPAGQMVGWYVVHELEQLLLARLHLAQGRTEQAQRLLESLLPAAESHQRMGVVMAIHIALALKWHASGDKRQALELLTGVLAQAEPEGYVRLFLDEGPAMAELLRLIPPDSPVAAYASRLLAAFTPVQPPGPLAEPAPGLLTERELDVLRLLPSHLTSTEIAAELNISANTARFHIKNIYSKLDVHNRTEAVTQARQLGLI